MESEAKYTLVGAAIIAMTATVVLAVVWLSRRGQENLTRYYTIYFQKHSLSGLQVDSYVTMRGIGVGSVRSLQIQPTDIERIKVVIALKGNAPVKTDTEAVIQRNMLTGLASVDLTKSSQNAEPLTRVDAGELYPVIPEGQGGLEQLKETLPEMLKNVGATLREVSALVSAENRERLTSTLDNLERISSRFSDLGDHFNSALDSVDSAADEVRGLARNLNDTTKDASKALGRSADGLSAAALHMSQDLSLAVQKLANTLERFENPKAILMGPETSVLGPGEKRK